VPPQYECRHDGLNSEEALPNYANVICPINIHGIGRSGTTLLQNILFKTGIVQSCNETGTAIFCTYRAGEMLPGSSDTEKVLSPANYGAAAVRDFLCALLPSAKLNWSQKVGGVPNAVVWQALITEADREYAAEPYEFPYEWYWKVMGDSFPESKDILIIRDYRDVIVSSCQKFNVTPKQIAQDIVVYYNILAHPASKVGYILHYEQLINCPEFTTSELCAFLGIEFKDAYLGAFDWHAAPSDTETLSDAKARGFSWAAKYDAAIDRQRAALESALDRLRRRFDCLLREGR
jgi:hypothetical protein